MEPTRIGETLQQNQVSEQASKCEKCGKRKKHRDDKRIRKWCRVCINAHRRDRDGRIEPLVKKIIPELFHIAELEHLSEPLRNTILSLPDYKGLMLWGEPGRGKTYAMMATAKHYIVEGWEVECVSYEIQCSRIRSSYQADDKGTEYEIINSLMKPDKLFVDDVGTTVSGEKQESDFSLRTFLNILDRRMKDCKPTFITTNKPVEQLRKSFDARIASRIEQACTVIHATGEDRRKQQTIKK